MSTFKFGDGEFTPQENTHMDFAPPPNPWAKLPVIAERLGVRPLVVTNGKVPGQASMVVQMDDGTCYDLFDVVIAFLDKMEQHTP